MVTNDIMEELLGIPNVTVKNIEITEEGEVHIKVESTLEGTHCHRCGHQIDKCHGHDRELELRHLPIFGKKTYLCIYLNRYQCIDCPNKPTTTQQVPWREKNSSHTVAYEESILMELIGSTITDVSVKNDIGYDAIVGIINRYIDTKVDWRKFKQIGLLGLDEISLKKGHKDFVTIVTGRIGDEVVVLGILYGRKKSTIKRFLSSMPRRLKKTVRAVCSDMYDGFINAAKEVFGKKVKIIIDRFHVAKLYRKGLDTLRKQELKRLRNELSEQEYKKLNGVMWLLRKKEESLDETDKATLELLFSYSPLLKLAYELSNQLTSIFNKKIKKESARSLIKNWVNQVKNSDLECFSSFLKTLTTRMNDIINYFIDRNTSGFVEGLNNKIKVIKRRCYGILNINHLFQRIQLDLCGYKLFS